MKFFETLLSGLKAIILSHSYSKKDSDAKYVGKDDYVKIHQEQADWNEADSQSFAYIKNKPFNKTIKDMVVIEAWFDANGMQGFKIWDDACKGQLIIGETYEVEFRYNTHTCTAIDAGNGVIILEAHYNTAPTDWFQLINDVNTGEFFLYTNTYVSCFLYVKGKAIEYTKIAPGFVGRASEDNLGLVTLLDVQLGELNVSIGNTQLQNVKTFVDQHRNHDYIIYWQQTDGNQSFATVYRPIDGLSWTYHTVDGVSRPGYSGTVVGVKEKQLFQLDMIFNEQNILKEFKLIPAIPDATYHTPIKDSITGIQHYLFVEDGKLATQCHIDSIEVITPPHKTEYYAGELFDPAGMVVVAHYADGTSGEITNKQWSEIVVKDSVVSIAYSQSNNIKNAIVNVRAASPKELLIDFDYIENEDGTYTLTDWKGTLNGEPSTEMVVPNNALFKI